MFDVYVVYGDEGRYVRLREGLTLHKARRFKASRERRAAKARVLEDWGETRIMERFDQPRPDGYWWRWVA